MPAPLVNTSADPAAFYERRFASLAGSRRAVAFAYARTALRCILAAAGLTRGDEVILSPLTCKVVPLALLSLGLKPAYADISPHTLNLDADHAESAIGSATRAVLFQHTYGSSAGIEAVAALTASKGISLFEDCAQCLPRAASSRPLGSWGWAAIFSNNLRKPIPAGSGGVAVTNDEDLAQRIAEMRDRFRSRGPMAEAVMRLEIWVHKYVLRPRLYWFLFQLNRKVRGFHQSRPVEHEISGEILNQSLRPSEYQMRIGLCWLKQVDTIVAHRRLCCAEYAAALSGTPNLTLPCPTPENPLYCFPVLVRGKEALLRKARRQRIELIPWPMRTPIYPVEKENELPRYGYQPGSCPVAEGVARRLVGLPTDLATRASQRAAVVELLKAHHACNGRN